MYAQLHQERVTDVDGVKYLSRYEDVSAMLNHPEMSNKQVIPIGAPLRESILLQDPPDHGRIRATAGKMLNKQPIEKFRNDVTAFAHRLISDVKPEGEMDFVPQVANKMPLLSLKSLFGISEEEILELTFHINNWVSRRASNDTEEKIRHAEFQDLYAIQVFFRKVIKHRLSEPQHRTKDLLSNLIQSHRTEVISEAELMDMCLLLTIGGIETTSTALSSVVMMLERHQNFKRMASEDVTTLSKFIDETLRLESPFKYSTTRIAKVNLEINGIHFPAGTQVVALFGAANRDPAVFEAPDELNIDRKGKPHLGFGFGIHYCVGVHFARLQLQAVIEAMFNQLPDWELKDRDRELKWIPNPLVRGLFDLPMRWTAR